MFSVSGAFPKTSWLRCTSISEIFDLFFWFLCLLHARACCLITLAPWDSFKSAIVTPQLCSFLFQIASATWVLLCFHVNFRVSLKIKVLC